VIGSLVGAFLLLELPLLTSAYRITVDEPWYSQVAWSVLNKHDLYNHTVGTGGGDVFFLYTGLLALFYKFFGVSLYVGRFLSVLCGVAAVIGVARVLYSLGVQWKIVMLCTAAFIASNLSYLTFRSIRPEAICAALAIWSTWFLLSFLRSRSPRPAALCGVLVGMGILCHPNLALLATAIGGVFVADAIRHRKMKPLLAYGLTAGALLLLLPVVIELSRHDGLAGVFDDLSRLDRLTAGSPGDLGFLSTAWDNTTHFFGRMTLGGKRLLIVVVEMSTLCAGLLLFRRLGVGGVLSFLVAGYLTLALLFFNNFDVRAFTEVEWMLFVVFALLLKELSASATSSWKPRAAILAFSLLVLNNLAGDLVVIKRGLSTTSYAEVSEHISALVPSNSVVLANQLFWFPLQESTTYSKHSRWHKLDYPDLDALIRSGDVDFSVFVDRQAMEKMMGLGKKGAWNDSMRKQLEHRDAVEAYSKSKGELIERFEVAGYGWLNVWGFTNRMNAHEGGVP
jgi:hypothetical protein